MGPKKQAKKQVIEQAPKQVEPVIPPHELQGYCKFEYPGGSYYEGQWRLIKSIKSKHGKGILFIQNASLSQIGKQQYQGLWEQDKMSGEGTYYFSDGSFYKGNWRDNKQSGKGTYEFANGTIYQGQWNNNKLHGSGFFVDHTGLKWQGQFRNGIFQGKRQAQFIKEKAITLKKKQIKKQIEATLHSMLEAISKSDKKTLKDNLAPFFSSGDNLKEYVKEPYSKFDERPPEKWTQLINNVKAGTFKIIQSSSEAIIISSDRILVKQFQGNGQYVQLTNSSAERSTKIALTCIQNSRWIILVATEQQKKK